MTLLEGNNSTLGISWNSQT